ncbi:MAG: SIR2 family NAD-dependent protein deacylase [Campylobacterota bacterium]
MAKVIIFSGAGISAQSGISTFRDSGGLWERYKIEDICSAGVMQSNRRETIEFYNKRRLDIKDKKPNYAHTQIAQLKNAHLNEVAVITQNVDDLFERAGCKEVVHLHGFLPNLRCESCECKVTIGYEAQDDSVKCSKCGSDLRPDIVFFGEAAPMYERLHQEIEDCEVFVVIGSSGNVIPTDTVAAFVDYSILNNLQPSEAIKDAFYNKVLYKKATDAIDEIVQDCKRYL